MPDSINTKGGVGKYYKLEWLKERMRLIEIVMRLHSKKVSYEDIARAVSPYSRQTVYFIIKHNKDQN